jgi:hypothetical protein
MPKSRRKADIRRRMAADREELDRIASERAAFKQPRPQSWHDVLLRELRDGITIEVAAQKAGVTRAGVRWARTHDRRFAEAYRAAYGKGLRLRFERKHGPIATNRSTTVKVLSTKKMPSGAL